MNQASATRTVTIANRAGLHARSALAITNCVREFQARVELVMNRQRVLATDVLQMISLCAMQGQSIRLEAAGPDAEKVLEALVRLFAAKFHEEDAESEQRRKSGG
jgi:phosphotransferase system HPr (HPr) family protein